jgi:hypothetical protein
MAIIKFLR